MRGSPGRRPEPPRPGWTRILAGSGRQGEGLMAVVLVDQDGVLAGFEQGLFGAFKAKHPNGPVVAVADRRGFYAREHYEKLGPEWGKAVMRSSAPRASTATCTRS